MNRFLLGLLLITVLFLFAQLAIKKSTLKSEESTYKVLARFDDFEIRQYPKLYVAKTKMATSGYDGNSSVGFRKVAGFIFGGNDSKTKIAMTSPVLMDMKDSVEMSFIMPSNIHPENAPTPNNSDVSLEYRPASTVAVVSFGGWASSYKLAKMEQQLLALLNKNEIEYCGEITYLGYNPPYQVFDRRNEISIEVKY